MEKILTLIAEDVPDENDAPVLRKRKEMHDEHDFDNFFHDLLEFISAELFADLTDQLIDCASSHSYGDSCTYLGIPELEYRPELLLKNENNQDFSPFSDYGLICRPQSAYLTFPPYYQVRVVDFFALQTKQIRLFFRFWIGRRWQMYLWEIIGSL